MTKKFEPTEEQRELVELLVTIGTKQEDICLVIKRPKIISKNGDSQRITAMVPIDSKTLRKTFREEIRTGAVKANAEVGKTMYQMAKSGQHPAMTIFYAKARMGFRETGVMQTQQLGADGSPVDPPRATTQFCVFPDGGPGRDFARAVDPELTRETDELNGIESTPPPSGMGHLNG